MRRRSSRRAGLICHACVKVPKKRWLGNFHMQTVEKATPEASPAAPWASNEQETNVLAVSLPLCLEIRANQASAEGSMLSLRRRIEMWEQTRQLTSLMMSEIRILCVGKLLKFANSSGSGSDGPPERIGGLWPCRRAGWTDGHALAGLRERRWLRPHFPSRPRAASLSHARSSAVHSRTVMYALLSPCVGAE